MNGSCAGGTGAFIDQMSTLLGIPMEEIDEYAAKAETIYPIRSVAVFLQNRRPKFSSQ